MHSDAKDIRERGDRLFSQKQIIDQRNQDIADQFYPERADFTTRRDLGDEYMDHLTTGYPVLIRRSLADSIGGMLRPRGQEWFNTRVRGQDDTDHEARRWLDWATGLQRRAMYDRIANFSRATKGTDNDFASFGAGVISTEINRRDNALIYRNWHLRDVAWTVDCYEQTNAIHVNWKPDAAELVRLFPGKVHPEVAKLISENRGQEKVCVRHVMMRSEDRPDRRWSRFPWVSIYIDVDHDHVMEERGSWTPIYTIPRWVTLSGSQYAYSPATMVALPDARLIQAMTLTILNAGEKAVDPPMVGVQEAIRSDLNLMAGGFTAVDADYDERLGEVLRPLVMDKSGLPFGLDMLDRTGALIREAFYLNTLSMPPQGGPEMTAYEVGQRVQEYIRNALPLFEPMEADYNGALCEITFETLMREGAFGPPDMIPASIRGGDVEFTFSSPLSEAEGREKGAKFLEAKAMLAATAEVDPSALAMVDFKTTLRDVLSGIGVPAKWLRSEEEVEAASQAQAEEQQAASMLGEMQAGADVAATLGGAAKQFSEARV